MACINCGYAGPQSVPGNRGNFVLELDEGERQMVLLALAELGLSRPGFDHMLSEIAQRIDNPGPQMYRDFQRTSADPERRSL